VGTDREGVWSALWKECEIAAGVLVEKPEVYSSIVEELEARER
jgi:hypothetical protein